MKNPRYKRPWRIYVLLALWGTWLSFGYGQTLSVNSLLPQLYKGQVTVVDIDLDGDTDIFICGQDSLMAPGSGLFLNNGTGTFTASSFSFPALKNSSAAWTNIMGSSRPELIYSGQDAGGNTVLYGFEGIGTVFNLTFVNLPAIHSGALITGDYDGDGDQDVFLSGFDETTGATTAIYLNNGAGSFTPTPDVLAPLVQMETDWADYDGDGDLDIIYMGYDPDPIAKLAFVKNQGSFVLTDTLTLPNVMSGTLKWCDYNGDTKPDIFVTGFSTLDKSFFLKNTGSGFVTEFKGIPGFTESSADFADYDNDGDEDLLIAGLVGSSRQMRIYDNDGTGNFTLSSHSFTGLADAEVHWFDMDGNTDLDFIVSGRDDTGKVITRVYQNTGTSFIY